MNKNLLSYTTFLEDRRKFQRAGSVSSDDFNIFDTPSHSYFKLLFYFWNEDSTNDLYHPTGLLAPTWQLGIPIDQLYNYNSAWSYLKINNENERAEKLEQFITLLSDISSESPWYFSEISGLDEAINRPQTTSNEFKLEDTRKKISIKCLPDSVDQRIGTLLNLYRDVTWSWGMKKEIIPANLRKFDMGLYIWEAPIYSLTSNAGLNESHDNEFPFSYKLIEFHNCEIDYNSVKSGFGNMTNKEGTQHEYTIDIMFDDCYEHNYNAFMMRTIGDVILNDIKPATYKDNDVIVTNDMESYVQGDENSTYNKEAYINKRTEELNDRILEASKREGWWKNYKGWDPMLIDIQKQKEYEDELKKKVEERMKSDSIWKGKGDAGNNIGKRLPDYPSPKIKLNGFLGNVLTELGGEVYDRAKSFVNKLLLGNLYTFSVSRMADQLKGALKGHVFSTAAAIKQYTNRGDEPSTDLSNENIYKRGPVNNDHNVNNNLGNLYKSNTLINNL